MLHLIKLAVGVRDVAQLEAVQHERTARDPKLRHRTRHQPKRAEDILAGGSLYWVIGGLIQARQLITGIEADVWEDGSKCCALVFDPRIIRVLPQARKAFQGWRYLDPADAPADLDSAPAATDMPEAMRRALVSLALL